MTDDGRRFVLVPPRRRMPLWKCIGLGLINLAVLWLLLATACPAQEMVEFVGVDGGDPQPRRLPGKVSLVKPLTIYGLALGADLASTEWAEARGAVERNAAYRGGVKYALHAATATVLTAADVWAQKRGKKWLVWTLRIGAVAAWGSVAARNLKTAP